MISHSRHSVTAAALPHLYSAAEVAEALGCSEWWVKEQARKGRIPFIRTGGGYRFTMEHFEEILRVFEKRPLRSQAPAPEGASAPRPRPRHPQQPTAPVVRLHAKSPRRSRRTDSVSAAA
ncbi:helix-turn-helix domain-containing protein [Streptomyces inhibens]|uniref:helix-turn-helix domain-containing protein n=1 Tax=Streptomyces inhibens TaxID=2293571 RepID=UPI00402ABB14